METKNYKGTWFLPQNRSEEITGVLNITKDSKYNLDLVGRFSGPHDLNKKIEIILGYSSEGKEITLIGCYIGQFNISSLGFSTCSFLINKILIGCHFNSYADIKFSKIDFKINSLDNWLNIYGFKPVNIAKDKPASIQWAYDLPSKIDFPVNDFFSGEFNFFVNTGMNHFAREVKINQTVKIRFQSKDLGTIDEYLDLIFSFQSFLALSFFQYLQIEEIECYPSLDNDLPIKNESKVNLLFSEGPIEKKEFRDFAFSFSDIEFKLDEVMTKWFSLFDNARPVIGGLIQSFIKSNTVTEFNFLNIIQSLETFHRRRRNLFLLSENDFKNKITEILDTVPLEHKNWVKEKLQYSNEPTLLDRLKEIVQELPTELRQKLFDNEIDFLKRVKDTRNYYTHYSKHLEQKSLKGSELFYTTEKLKVILATLLLKEVAILDNKFEAEYMNNASRLFYYTFKDFKSVVP